MSTKSSIVWGDNVHFYQDLMDEDGNFYLELRNEFSSTTLKIPPHIWEAVRVHGVDFDLINLSDNEIKHKAENTIKERFQDNSIKDTVALWGNYEEQVKYETEYLFNERKRQKDIKEKMKDLKSI